MSLKDLIAGSERLLVKEYPDPKEAHALVLALLEDVLGIKKYTHIVEPSFEVPEPRVDYIYDLVKRLAEGEPLQYILGYETFFGRRFHVDGRVLIPRPETEILCRKAVDEAMRIKRLRDAYGKNAEPVRVLDLCTGSGCIAWTLALEVPGVQVTGIDISADAIDVASGQEFSKELKKTSATAPVFFRADIGKYDDSESFGDFDMILANPPYVMEKEKIFMRTNVLGFEPGLALFVPDDDPLVFYRHIAVWARRSLRQGGTAYLEINEALGKETADVFRSEGFRNVKVIKDFNEKSRFVSFEK